MTDALSKAIVESWTIPLFPTISVIVAAIIYLRGWSVARVTRPNELPSWRALCFIGGLLALWLALASPIDALGQFLLIAHMTQHLVLMSVAPPLIVLGAPTVPMLRGLPKRFVRDDLSPWMNSEPFHKAENLLSHPVFTWLLMNGLFLIWHIPVAYELALRSNSWHEIEHGCFFLGSLPFWWFVIRPWPSRNRWSPWLIVPYLMLADIANTALSASLTFSGRVLYPTYAHVPRIAGISALQDQIAAGAGMWVLGSLFFLVPLAMTTMQLLQSRRQRFRTGLVQITGATTAASRFDLLRTPIIGSLLRSRYGRMCLQSVSLLLAACFIVQGIRGVQISGLNLSGTVAWNIVRPLMFLSFLLAGNLFCMACPFTLPRELARALGLAKYRWPARLRNKWTAALLMIVFFWAYEQFALWNSPALTAWLVLGYFVTAFAVDSIFQGASFCKYVCPIGQFNFVTTLLSPLELDVSKQQVCSSCRTKDCIRGNAAQRGCELQLYLPNKVGNLDCTLCMDCVKACPHDNIGLTLHSPTRELTRDPLRSSIGRLSTRSDFTVLLLIVTFSSVINAGLMIAPVADRLADWESRYSILNTNLMSLALSLVASGVLLLCALATAKLMQSLSDEKRLQRLLGRFALAALPLGLGMWAAHLLFHLSTASTSLLPTIQQAWIDIGLRLHGPKPASMMSMVAPLLCKPLDVMLVPGAKGIDLLTLQIWLLDLGMLLTLYAGWRVVRDLSSSAKRRAAMASVWLLSSGTLYALCVWIFTQPMQMRGMGM